MMMHFRKALPDEGTLELTEFELKLYERQIQLPGFGTTAQRQLRNASAMISRVGGLGGTVAMLLARAGIGKLVLAHDGVVEHENLNRMHLAFREDIGKSRIKTFRDTLRRINPGIEIVAEGDNVSSANVRALVAQSDLVIDGAPLFTERYAMNVEAVRRRKPLVMAAMFGLESYITTIVPGRTPCLSCLYPDPPEYWDLRMFPVIAPSSSQVASIAAMEAVKLITGYGEPLLNQLLYSDLSNNTFRRFNIERHADCPVCGSI
jgi:molybdopterin/thiamine biosynthesis adenylyltransferase